MKKGLLLFASLFILGASSISASTTEKISETVTESDYQKWIIIIYSGTTGAIIHQETGCYTFDTIHDRIQEFGGKYYQDDITFDVVGQCN
ncbi:hypothetical protein LNQ81_13355 [Myroides sp. M-43]|uniref:hypothetical protein n=1 Tax=Myroides oncorhynchi TaxID=2893756 RepID=UPI001E3992A6|nr:hypothetical protein [Myroides oncorhynchi]MCC9043659.1 hypothetical protein [Myroides oncorhynchi]